MLKEFIVPGLIALIASSLIIGVIAQYVKTVVNQAGMDLVEVANAIAQNKLNRTIVDKVSSDFISIVNKSNTLMISLHPLGNSSFILDVNGFKTLVNSEELGEVCRQIYSLNQTLAEKLAICRPFLHAGSNTSASR
ncbi:hypothetical protein CF15_07045 [Pyrodictium occultum]|uniref:Uncharacterized protein n=1 Tax=Pyrodictium occultum TaxID=2309 RepID=A0A0V8RWM8_PYROC|nr:hypothetical protein [Pyrodictium occultum]KSW12471.1 hypothetical protein CF15_07045 [Pyrodictium occultum]